MPSLKKIPPFSEAGFKAIINFAEIDAIVSATCQLAAQNPKSLYLFMQRYTHFNGYAGSLVARLASSIGLSRDLFNANSLVRDEADRGLNIAAKVLAATIDEHADQGAQNAPHRTLAQATLKAVGDYAELDVIERNSMSQIPDWLNNLLHETIASYQGVPGDVKALIRALGFHAASETLADHEYKIIDRVVRHECQRTGFGAYLREVNGKVELEGQKYSAWYWIAIHGKHDASGVEAQHFDLALEALNLAARYRPEPDNQIKEWAMQGFTDFVEIQQRLFQEIAQECQKNCFSYPCQWHM